MNRIPPLSQPSNYLKTWLANWQRYRQSLRRRWWLLLILALPLFGFAYYFSKGLRPTYTAAASFMTNNDSASGVSGLMQLAGQFGFGVETGSDISSEKLMELLSSKRIIYSTLMKTLKDEEGKDELLINYYLKNFVVYSKVKAQQPDIETEGFLFAKDKKIEDFDVRENLLMQEVYHQILTSGLAITTSKSGIIQLRYATPSEVFSKYFLEYLVKTLSDFYVSKSVQAQREAYELVNKRVDSIKVTLGNAEYRLSHWYDREQPKIRAGAVSADSYVDKIRLERDVEFMSVVLGEAIKNQEIAKMNLDLQKPLIQIIDFPTLPLEKKDPPTFKFYILALFLALLAWAVWVLVLQIIQDALHHQPTDN